MAFPRSERKELIVTVAAVELSLVWLPVPYVFLDHPWFGDCHIRGGRFLEVEDGSLFIGLPLL